MFFKMLHTSTPFQTTTEKADAPEEDSTRKFDFGELKFGAEYDPKKAK